MGKLTDLLDGAAKRFKMSRGTKKQEKKMEKELYDELYEKYKDKVEAIYAKGKAAIDDGFDFKDLEVLKDLIKELKDLLDSMQEDLSLDEKKAFIVYHLMGLYDVYYKKLPWWAMFIPLKKYFVKKYVVKYVGKALDYLHDKGVVKKPGA